MLTAHLILVSNKVHTAFSRADLKSIWLVYLILSTFDGQASVDLMQQQSQCCFQLPRYSTMEVVECFVGQTIRCTTQTSMTPRGIESCSSTKLHQVRVVIV